MINHSATDDMAVDKPFPQAIGQHSSEASLNGAPRTTSVLPSDEAIYRIALATLDVHIGILFNAWQKAQVVSAVDKETASALRVEFDGLYKRRDHLREATEVELQALIEELGPKVRKAVEDLRATPSACTMQTY